MLINQPSSGSTARVQCAEGLHFSFYGGYGQSLLLPTFILPDMTSKKDSKSIKNINGQLYDIMPLLRTENLSCNEFVSLTCWGILVIKYGDHEAVFGHLHSIVKHCHMSITCKYVL